MPLIINDVRNRMKCHLVKPEELINPLSLSSKYKYKLKLNDETPVEEQLKVYTPAVIDLEKEVNETPQSTGDIGLRGTGMVEEKKTSPLDDTVSLEEQRLVRLYSYKPSRCGSCLSLQKFDGNKYCHVCNKDPHYLNPESMNNGPDGKCIQDYHLIKKYQSSSTPFCFTKEHEQFDATESLDHYMTYKAFTKNLN